MQSRVTTLVKTPRYFETKATLDSLFNGASKLCKHVGKRSNSTALARSDMGHQTSEKILANAVIPLPSRMTPCLRIY